MCMTSIYRFDVSGKTTGKTSAVVLFLSHINSMYYVNPLSAVLGSNSTTTDLTHYGNIF